MNRKIWMQIKIVIPAFILLMTGCTANYYVTPDEFINQVAEKQYKTENPTGFYVVSPLASLFFNQKYGANNIRKVLCRDKAGNLLYLFPDRNTQLEITSKSTNDIVKMYFDTVFFEGNKLVGLRSRLVPGMTREIVLTDIEKIEIYAEFPRTEKVDLK
ncbi:hypothetical protein [Geobacter sulfurreducens]|uniref:hypothetical protein n=1 Tax=Geobacter sulfurreducens TaxID=35554 RepID=UPI0001E342EC|nr:hypothetical protein [Geobacter sulfurreducens]ADN78327.1 hypothetical protein KN400_3430 [Geobacter sulfurreducens KN400]